MRRTLLIAAAALASSLPQTASAEQIVEVVDDGVVSAYVSSTGVTRIKFISDQAKEAVIADGGSGPGFTLANIDGDIFLTMDGTSREGFGAASFFVKTRSGVTYQFELASKETPSTQIFVRNPELAAKQATVASPRATMEERVVQLTQAMWTGALPSGFEVRRPRGREVPAGPVRLRPLAEYRGTDLTGRVLSVRNPASGDISIDEDLFMAPGVVAVSIKGDRTLGPGATVDVLIIDRSAS